MTEGLSVESIKRLRERACSSNLIIIEDPHFRLSEPDIGPRYLFLSQKAWDIYLEDCGFEKDHKKEIWISGHVVHVSIIDIKLNDVDLTDSRKSSKKFYMDIDKKHKRKKNN